MRDPKRIDPTIEILRKTWQANPDWRLGQVIANAVRVGTGRVNCDPFYIEDDDMLEALESILHQRI